MRRFEPSRQAKISALIDSMDQAPSGRLRGYLQDKWMVRDNGGYPAKMKLTFMNIVSHGQIHPISFFGKDPHPKIWNGTSLNETVVKH